MTEPIGYQWLVRELELQVMPHHCRSYIARQASGSAPGAPEGVTVRLLSASYARPNEPGPQLEFAVRHEGVNLEILLAAFEALGPSVVEQLVRAKPTGKHARRLWYLYELLIGEELNLPRMTRGSYVDLLDADHSYTAPPRPVQRQRVRDNMLGDAAFCPSVRRTDALREWEDRHLDEKARQLIEAYDEDTLQRALSYLYVKETKSSFEIERESPSDTRVERFVRALQRSPAIDEVSKSTLLELQARIVEPRFVEGDYRQGQNYVGETLGLHREKVHYVSPKPGDVAGLMAGLLRCQHRLLEEPPEVHAVVAAAVIAFGFVFIHPFEDGNGRIHRFLIHDLLSRLGFAPKGLIFPVSAAMLADSGAYDRCLERFSRPLLELIDYDLSDDGELSVLTGDTAPHYRYFDATPMAEQLFAWIDQTIARDLRDELDFVQAFHAARDAVSAILDMPDKELDLFVKLCWQNAGRFPKRKRERFEKLGDDEIAAMSAAVRDVMSRSGSSQPTRPPAPDR